MDNDTNSITAVIGMNDHPSVTFSFDTHNFHSQDTVWFLDYVNFDGCRQDSLPVQFYKDMIEFCQKQIK